MSTVFLAEAPVALGARPVGDDDRRAPGFWSRLQAVRVERAGDDVAGRLHAAIALERGFASRLAVHADRWHGHPDVCAALLELAARAEDRAERLAAAIGELGCRARPLEAICGARATARGPISTDIDGVRAATDRYLDDACAVARRHPWLSRLLLSIRDDAAADLRQLVQLHARLGLDGPDDDGAAPVPAVPGPHLDPLLGRKDIDVAA